MRDSVWNSKNIFFMILLISFMADGAEARMYMKVTSPNGGETWTHASGYNIKWDKPFICTSNVKLYLYRSEALVRTISESTSNDGEYYWIVGHDLGSGNDYKIKAQCSNYFYTTKDYSDDFSIASDISVSSISVIPGVVGSDGTSQVTVRVTTSDEFYNKWPLSGAYVSFFVDAGTISNGYTDENGYLRTTYYAPTVTKKTYSKIKADISKDGYGQASQYRDIYVIPKLQVSVSEYPDPVGSGGTSQVTVKVTSGGLAVNGSLVNLEISGGTLDIYNGYTDLYGYLRTKYYAPIVITPTYYTILATASKRPYIDYIDGKISDYIIVGTTDPSEQQITTNAANQEDPAISGNRIVWEDRRNGNADIYMYDLSTNIENRITTNSSQQVSPAIDGNRIVWRDYRNGVGSDIYMYDLSTNKEKRITTNTAYQSDPAISGNGIVWSDKRNGNMDIYMYDLSTNTERRITTNTANQYSPSISGIRIVWFDDRNGNYNWDIYMYDLSTNTERRITTNTSNQYSPAIDGNRIVWEDNRNGNRDIYMYDLSTNTERQITTNTAYQYSPSISGTRIAWYDFRNGYADIYMYDLSTNTESRITTSKAFRGYPAISGNRIVWEDGRNGNMDIFMYSDCAP